MKANGTVHVATLMDLCHLEKSQLDNKFRKYRESGVLRGDIVRVVSGNCAVFREHGASASQMTAPRVLDAISGTPGCSGHSSDAVSAYTKVKIDEAPKLLQLPEAHCPVIWNFF